MNARPIRKTEPDLPGLFDDIDPDTIISGQTRTRSPGTPMAGANDDEIIASDKIDVEELELRGSPQPVKRLSPRAIIFLSAVALSALAGITIAALRPPKIKSATTTPENYDTALKAKPDALEELPKTYADWLQQIRDGKRPALPMGNTEAVPQLGPPLPGDIGHAYALQSGLAAPAVNIGSADGSAYASTAQMSAAQQRRAEQMRQIEQAQGSGLFFGGNASAKPTTVSSQDLSDKATLDLLTRLAGGSSRISNAVDTSSVNALPPSPASNDAQNRSQTNSIASGLLSQKQLDSETLNPHALTPLASPYTVLAGSLIPAALITELNSDLPGLVQAQVTENVYDSVTGKWLLIPQGAKLIGSYDARVLFGQERALLVWTRLILPDGSSMVLDSMTGVDVRGAAGVGGEVNAHSGRLIKGVILSSLLGVGSELSFGGNNDNSLRALARAIQDSGNSAGQEIIRRNLEVKPTIKVRSGTKVQVLVSQDLLLKPWGAPK
jgi:type IV secretion system protein TrbI